jgi:UDP-N-acetylmuramate dehydrogenase
VIDALQATGATVQASAPLDRQVYWRVGGPAEWLAQVTTLKQLQAVMDLGAVTVLGNGSNILVHDAGLPGIVVRLGGELADLQIDGTRAVAGAGLLLTVFLARLDKAGLAGAEPFSGVPGTIGGAVVMNAGTLLGEAADLVESVDLVLPGGELRQVSAADLAFGYRSSTLPEGAVIARATLALTDEDVADRLEKRQAFLARRKATQPLDKPSCGSTFTNPPGDHAARLIEAAGLKGHRQGNAEISGKHANFIVNLGGATAEEIRHLIALARCTVRDQFSVWMDPEVHLLGPWAPDALEKP